MDSPSNEAFHTYLNFSPDISSSDTAQNSKETVSSLRISKRTPKPKPLPLPQKSTSKDIARNRQGRYLDSDDDLPEVFTNGEQSPHPQSTTNGTFPESDVLLPNEAINKEVSDMVSQYFNEINDQQEEPEYNENNAENKKASNKIILPNVLLEYDDAGKPCGPSIISDNGFTYKLHSKAGKKSSRYYCEQKRKKHGENCTIAASLIFASKEFVVEGTHRCQTVVTKSSVDVSAIMSKAAAILAVRHLDYTPDAIWEKLKREVIER